MNPNLVLFVASDVVDVRFGVVVVNVVIGFGVGGVVVVVGSESKTYIKTKYSDCQQTIKIHRVTYVWVSVVVAAVLVCVGDCW